MTYPMTPEERQELRRWSAEDLLGKVVGNPKAPEWLQRYIGGHLVSDWRPDSDDAPMWQINCIFDAMQSLNYDWLICNGLDGKPVGCIITKQGHPGAELSRGYGDTFQTAFLLAAKAAWESGRYESS